MRAVGILHLPSTITLRSQRQPCTTASRFRTTKQISAPTSMPPFTARRWRREKGSTPHAWIKEPVAEELCDLDLRFDRNNGFFQMVEKAVRTAAEIADGNFIVHVPDYHSNLDTLSALLSPQNLCYELMDNPEILEEKLNQINNDFDRIYNIFYEAGNMKQTGTLSWLNFEFLSHGGARKKTVTKVPVFFQRCVPQAERDVHFVRDVSFGSEVCLRHVIRNTSHHCERSEQLHYAKHNITLA